MCGAFFAMESSVGIVLRHGAEAEARAIGRLSAPGPAIPKWWAEQTFERATQNGSCDIP